MGSWSTKSLCAVQCGKEVVPAVASVRVVCGFADLSQLASTSSLAVAFETTIRVCVFGCLLCRSRVSKNTERPRAREHEVDHERGSGESGGRDSAKRDWNYAGCLCTRSGANADTGQPPTDVRTSSRRTYDMSECPRRGPFAGSMAEDEGDGHDRVRYIRRPMPDPSCRDRLPPLSHDFDRLYTTLHHLIRPRAGGFSLGLKSGAVSAKKLVVRPQETP